MQMRRPSSRALSWFVDAMSLSLVILFALLVFRVHSIDEWLDLLSIIKDLAGLSLMQFYTLHEAHVFHRPMPDFWIARRERLGYDLKNPKWIRLCKVYYVDPREGGFQLSLEKFLLDRAPPYRAVSYTWGPAEGGFVESDGVILNFKSADGRDNSWPMNLASFFYWDRDQNYTGYYWIDAVCIDQTDYRERNEQVNIMDRIYQKATAVDVWLGKPYSDTKTFNGILLQLAQFNNLPAGKYWNDGEYTLAPMEWHTFVHMLSRRWFHRLWTLQEFALAREVRMTCGNVEIDVDNLLRATQYLSDHAVPLEMAYGTRKTITSATFVQLNMLRQAVRNHEFLNFDFLTCLRNSSPEPSYEAVLVWVYWRSIATIATDARDHVYGLIGVANAIANRLGLRYEPYHADYALTTAETFQEFIVYLMQSGFELSAISLVRQSAGFTAVEPSGTKPCHLPSWVPDLANRDFVGLSTNGGLNPAASEESCFTAAGFRDITSEYLLPIVDGSRLRIHAHHIGVITGPTESLPKEGDKSGNAHYGLGIMRLLLQLPPSYPGNHQTPVEALLTTLRVGSNTTDNIRSSDQATLERLLAAGLHFYSYSLFLALDPANESFEHVMAAHVGGGNSVHWGIHGLSLDFPTIGELLWSVKRNFVWWLFAVSTRSIPPGGAVEATTKALQASCRSFLHEFAARIPATKLFLLRRHTLDAASSQNQEQQSAVEEKWLGLGHDKLQADDEIWVAPGAAWPLILRPRPRSPGMPQTFEFVGEAYVHGIMHGEAFEHAEPVWQEVVLD